MGVNKINYLTNDILNIIQQNIFNIISIIISGLISWLISWYYFYKSNRNNFQMSVVLRINEILDMEISEENRIKMQEIMNEYSFRYIKPYEKKIFIKLMRCYEKSCKHEEYEINAESVFQDFKLWLEKNNINFKTEPIIIDDNIIDYTYPTSFYMLLDIFKDIFKKYGSNMCDLDYEECEEELFFKIYLYLKINKIDKIYPCNNLKDIVNNSPIKKKYMALLNDYYKAKTEFKHLKVVKSI